MYKFEAIGEDVDMKVEYDVEWQGLGSDLIAYTPVCLINHLHMWNISSNWVCRFPVYQDPAKLDSNPADSHYCCILPFI